MKESKLMYLYIGDGFKIIEYYINNLSLDVGREDLESCTKVLAMDPSLGLTQRMETISEEADVSLQSSRRLWSIFVFVFANFLIELINSFWFRFVYQNWNISNFGYMTSNILHFVLEIGNVWVFETGAWCGLKSDKLDGHRYTELFGIDDYL